jgi:excisionase family DNA binding protein
MNPKQGSNANVRSGVGVDKGKEKIMGKRYVTVQDAVNLLNTSERTVRRMIKAGRLHTIRDKTNHIWIDQDDLEQEREAKPRSANPLPPAPAPPVAGERDRAALALSGTTSGAFARAG